MKRRTRSTTGIVGALLLVLLASACVVPPPPPPPQPVPRPLKVSYFGDSVAYTYAIGTTATAAIQAGDMLQVSGSIRLGCAVGRYTRFTPTYLNPQGLYNMLCDWSQDVTSGSTSYTGYANTVATYGVDLPTLYFCGWDVPARRIPLGPDTWDTVYRTMGDPIYENFLLSEFRTMTDHLLSSGARAVVVLTCGTPYDSATQLPRAHAPGVALWNDFLRTLPSHDSRMKVIEAGPFIDAQATPYVFRPDGQHFDWAGAQALADQYVDAQILQLADQLW